MTSALPVSRLIRSSARLSWQEAVALVQGICAAAARLEHHEPALGTFEEFLIVPDGRVAIVAGHSPSLSVSEVALLLGRLLPAHEHHGAAADLRTRPAPPKQRATATPSGDNRCTPAGIHFMIGRALGLVEAPPFDGVAQFSVALERFETQNRARLLRAILERYVRVAASTEQEMADPQQATHCSFPSARESAAEAVGRLDAAGPRSSPGTARLLGSRSDGWLRVERRRNRMPSDVLRRLLREEDHRNYLASVASPQPTLDRPAGPRADMLRRFIRETDERCHEVIRALRAHGARTGHVLNSVRPTRLGMSRRVLRGRVTVAGLLLALFAGGGAEFAHFASRTPSRPSGGARSRVEASASPMAVVQRGAERGGRGTSKPANELRGGKADAVTPGSTRRDAAGPAPGTDVHARVSDGRMGRVLADDDRPPTNSALSPAAAATPTPTARPALTHPPALVARVNREGRGSAIPRFFKLVGGRIGKLLRPDLAADSSETGYRDVTTTGATAR